MPKIINDKKAESIIHQAEICYLAMSFENYPYIVPMNFGYNCGTLYFHSKTGGKKNKIMAINRQVCCSFVVNPQLKPSSFPCHYSMGYQSLFVFGIAAFINDISAKKKALFEIFLHYQPKVNKDVIYQLEPVALKAVTLFKVDIQKWTIKERD